MTVKVKTREILSTIKAYPLNKSLAEVQKQYGFEKAYKLAENENIFGCSPLIKEKLIEQLDSLYAYPDGNASELTTKLANFLNVHPNELFIGNGSDEIIRLLIRAYLNVGEEAIMADITFPRYKTNVLIEGGTPVIVPLIDGVHDLQGMLSAITEKTKILFVCNPNNPTGTIVEKEQLLTFLAQVPEDILIVLDEAYYEYATSDSYLQSLPQLKKYSNLVILRTFSKIYGIAALRVGYGIMNPTISTELTKVKEVFNVNKLAQSAAILALEDQEYMKKCVQKNFEGKQFLEKELTILGYTFFPSEANFVMIHTKQRGDKAAEALLKHGIIVRAGTLLGYPYTIRVTISSNEDNTFFMNIFKQLSEKGEA